MVISAEVSAPSTKVVQAVRRWSFRPEGQTTAGHLAYAAQSAVIADDRGNVYVVDDKGEVSWRQNLGARVVGARITADGKAIYALTGGELFRFNWKGNLLWRVRTPAPATAMDVRSSTQSVLVACGDLLRVVSSIGKPVLGLRVRHGVRSARVAGRSGGMVVCSDRGYMTYIDREGQPLWEATLNVWCGAVDQDGDGSVVTLPAGSDGIYSFDATGAPRGIYDISSAVRAAAIDDLGKRLIVAGYDGLTRVLDASDGRTLWHGPSQGEPLGADMDPSGDRALVLKATEIDLLDFVDSDEERGEFLEVEETAAAQRSEATPEWRLNLRSGDPSPAPVFAQVALATKGTSVVVMEPGRRQLLSFDARGKLQWRQQTPIGDQGEGSLRMVAARRGNLLAIGAMGGLMLATYDQGPVATFNVNVRTLSVSDVGNAVLAGDAYGTLHLYDAEAEENWSAPTDGFVEAQLSPRGDAFALGRSDGVVRYYNRRGGTGWQLDLTPGPQAQVGLSEIRIACLDDGIAYCVYDGRVGVMDPSGQTRWETRIETRPIGIQRCGNRLAVTDTKDVVYLFTLSGEALRRLPTRRGVSVLADGGVEGLLEFHYNGKEINCFDVERGLPVWQKVMPARVNGLARSGCGEYLVVLAGTHLVKLRLGPVEASKEDAEAPPARRDGCFLEL